MRTPKVYLETAIFSFPFADDAPQYKADTLRLFEEIRTGKFEPYTSVYVVDELERTKDTERRGKMKALVTDYGIEVMPANPEVRRLADLYIREGVIPEKKGPDAIHIAAATVGALDFIVSLNFQHIVKRKTIVETEIINVREGYRRVYIHTPMEVIEYDEDA